MTGPALLEVENLQTYFKTGAGLARPVDGVSFSIQAGETFALVGESGSGKSVTALSILQLLAKPAGYIAGGSIRFRGREISRLSPKEMRGIRGNQISMIFQEPMTALNPVFTIGNQIVEVLKLHQNLTGEPARRRAVETLADVGIPDPERRFHEYSHQMSGGMRQRVMIAMALACRPDLLIADEPTTALDVTIQAQILQLMREMRGEYGTAVLLITHDMGVVRENADHVGVMYAGRIVESASREALFARPSHPYTQLLLRSLPSRGTRGRRLATIEGMVPKPTDFPPGCRFSNRCPFAMEICHTTPPPTFEVAAGHAAACFLLDPSAKTASTVATLELPVAPPSALQRDVVRLRVQNLQTHFPIRKGVFQRVVGQVKAVDGVDLTIRKGETLALVGESGCGKTTVGKTIVRLLDASGGLMEFHNDRTGATADLAALKPAQLKPFRRRIQMVFQDPFSSLNPRLMVGETILEGMETHGIGESRAWREKRIAELMAHVGLDPAMATRYPHEFSGGQRQRVGVARSLAVDPELLICDEATSSLDVSVQAQILNLLKDLQSELGLSYLFITHDLSVVQYLADRVSVMYLGRVVEEGTAEEIFASARHPYTRALLSAVPVVDAETGRKRIVLEGDVPSPITPPQGCHFHPRCPEARPECRQAYPASVAFSETHSCRCILYPQN
jgi:peptide/nickel transport system ATP-binding protein